MQQIVQPKENTWKRIGGQIGKRWKRYRNPKKAFKKRLQRSRKEREGQTIHLPKKTCNKSSKSKKDSCKS